MPFLYPWQSSRLERASASGEKGHCGNSSSGFSLATEGYWCNVSPDAQGVDSYDGWGTMVSAGAFVIPKQLEWVGRWSRLRLDRSDHDTELEEWGLGVNLYHNEHNWKTRLNYLNANHSVNGQTDSLILEWHLQF